MRCLFSLLTLGLAAISTHASSLQKSNLTYLGAPRLNLDGVPPHFDVAMTTSNAPSCGKNSGSASRRVAYYQSWNSRRRDCDKVLPSQLDLTGITHLVLAFATIDPKTFQVGFMNKDDQEIYKQFLALPDNVSKWIGIGGFEFSDTGATRNTWSELVSSRDNRKAFSDSLKQFLSKWQFRGVDIDWEWPGHAGRGGSSQDGQNQVELVKEMREALGKDFGLGVVLPAQYDYMSNMDPKGLEAHVDWMSILTYDLHGQWDQDIPGLGAKIKPHTDLKEIDIALDLLWSKNIDSKKVNLGIANYGRGYTVADKNCMYYGCAFTGPSKKGLCTSQDGVLSTCEIRRLISEKKLSWNVIAGGAEVNEVTWDDQWIGFDDAGTLGKKLELANDRCLGGTALWAIDYSTCPSDGGSPQPSQPGNAVSPSSPASSSASSIASPELPPVASSPAVSAIPSSVPSASQSSPASTLSAKPSFDVPSSAAPSSVASSQQGPSPPDNSTPVPAPSPGPSSATIPPFSSGFPAPSSATPSSGPWTTSTTPQGSSTGPSFAASSAQASSTAGLTQTTGSSSAVPSSSGSATTIIVPLPSPSSNAQSPQPSSSQARPSNSLPSSSQSGSSDPWHSSGLAPSASSSVWSSSAVASTSSMTVWTSPAAPSDNQSGFSTPVPGSSNAAGLSSGPVSSSIQPSTKPNESSITPSGSDIGPSTTPHSSSDAAKTSNAPVNSSGIQASSSSTGPTSDASESLNPTKTLDAPKSSDTPNPSDAPKTSDAARTSNAAKPSSSTTPGTQPWCPDECRSLPWCNVFCETELPEVPPAPCWEYDWCWWWWGFSRHKKEEKDGKTCKILGCGCGWMGLPWGPGCPPGKIELPAWIKIVIELFGLFPDPCKFWGCKGGCGLFGCDGWCFGEGCEPCPKEICKGDGPKPGPFPTPLPPHVQPPKPPNGKPKKCEAKDMKTAIERFVMCNELVSLSSAVSATTISTWVSTQVTTATSSSSSCSTWLDITITGCNVQEDMMTKTVSQTKSNSISETPGPACTRAPLSLDDDEGDNIGRPGFESTSMLGNITDAPSRTSTILNSASFTSSMATPTCTDNRPCWNYFDQTCVVQRCIDTNDPEFCAYRCLSDMCLAPNAPRDCSTGKICAHPACPHEVMGAPATNFTVTITYPSNGPTKTWTIPANSSYTKTWWATPSPTSSIQTTWSETWSEASSFEISTSTSSTPKPTPGPMDKNGKWTVQIRLWRNEKEAHLHWTLLDPNLYEAGQGDASSQGKDDVGFYVESKNRPIEHMMPFGVNGWMTDWTKFDDTRVQFVIQKTMPGCDTHGGSPCKPSMWTESRLETKMFEVNTCWQFCKNVQDRKVLPSDMNCNDLNDADWYDYQDGNQHRVFECYWKGF